jgi:hypothetical protein
VIPPEWETAWRAAGDAYDAEVRRIWSEISPDLITRQAWSAARPGMTAAKEACEAALDRIRAAIRAADNAPPSRLLNRDAA